jgi:hypothetical protein
MQDSHPAWSEFLEEYSSAILQVICHYDSDSDRAPTVSSSYVNSSSRIDAGDCEDLRTTARQSFQPGSEQLFATSAARIGAQRIKIRINSEKEQQLRTLCQGFLKLLKRFLIIANSSVEDCPIAYATVPLFRQRI